MSEKMSIRGVGPTVGGLMVAYLIAASLATYFWPSLFTVDAVPYAYLVAVAVVLLVLGVPMYVITILLLWKGYREDRLVTTGTYAVCRNPIYATWILLFLPAIGLLLKSWLVLTTAVFMYVVTRIKVRREEKYLEERFGQQYLDYKKRVGAVFPTFRK